MENTSFKERVKNISIECATKYRDNLCEYEYAIISEAFEDKYFVISAETDNYMHLIGINSSLSPQEFYNKCIDKTLTEDDFDFNKKNLSEKSVKGSVREKIVVLSDFCDCSLSQTLNANRIFQKERFHAVLHQPQIASPLDLSALVDQKPL